MINTRDWDNSFRAVMGRRIKRRINNIKSYFKSLLYGDIVKEIMVLQDQQHILNVGLNKLFLSERFRHISRIPKCQIGTIQYLMGTDGKWYKSWEYPKGVEGKDDWGKKLNEEPK